MAFGLWIRLCEKSPVKPAARSIVIARPFGDKIAGNRHDAVGPPATVLRAAG